jgi:hypothetical protein
MLIEFLHRFSKNTQISSFIKIHPVGAELLHTYRWTEGEPEGQIYMAELIVAFQNFANTSENNKHFSYHFIWEWNFVFHTEEGKRTENVREQDASKLFGIKRTGGKCA